MQLNDLIRKLRSRQEGQSLLETAVSMPLMLGVAFNIINWGYFWFMVLSLAAAPRMAVQYASQGGVVVNAPTTTGVRDVAYNNMTNMIHGATTSNAAVRVCTYGQGVASNVSACTSYGPSFGFTANTADPEAPAWVLNRVDVEYTVTPIIPGSAFNVFLPTNMNFHRTVAMRNLFF